jgi:hypothetical protein
MTLKQLHLYILALLLACTSAAWGQAQFEDRIGGAATACSAKEYMKSGNTKGGYTLQGQAKSSCKTVGSATSQAKAYIGPPVVSMSASSKRGPKQPGGAAGASGGSMDTAILSPPEGFNGDSVKVVADTGYSFKLQGETEPKTAGWEIDWVVNGKPIHQVESTSNGNGNVDLKLPFKIQKTSDGFEFTYEVDDAAEATFGASASCATAGVVLKLPSGWTYKWASDDAGYANHAMQREK